jgi:hypothetical protein
MTKAKVLMLKEEFIVKVEINYLFLKFESPAYS